MKEKVKKAENKNKGKKKYKRISSMGMGKKTQKGEGGTEGRYAHFR